MLKQKILPILVIFPLVLASCIIPIGDENNSNGNSTGIFASPKPTSSSNSDSVIKIPDLPIDKLSNQGLIAYYPFNGNSNDESGSGYNGVVKGAELTTDRFGNPNKAFKFDGKSYIEVPNMSSEVFGRDYTISAWVLFNNFSADYPHIICGKDNFITLHGKGNAYGSNKGQVAFYQESYLLKPDRRLIPEVNTLDKLEIGKFHHVVFTKKGNDTFMYLDGKLKSSGTTQAGELVKAEGLYIGTGFLKEPNQSMSGVIDDIRIYSRNLTQDEITNISNGKENSTPIVVKPTSSPISTPVPTPSPTSISISNPTLGDSYNLYKREVEVSLSGFKPDGIHGGEPARETFYFKGALSDLKLLPYDPLRGLEEVKDGAIVVNWVYDNNTNYKTSGAWTPVPNIVKDGEILPMEESVTLHSKSGPFVEGNVNARVHFGGSNYYYLVSGDGEYGKDPNVIWGETKINQIIKNKFDQKLNVTGHDEFAINIWYQWGNNFVGWWYYYKK
jgi:hypothetical protein